MPSKPIVVKGVVRGGVVVFDPPTTFPEGTEVDVTIAPIPFTPEEQAEFTEWQNLRDDAWAMIDEWEKEDDSREAG